MKDNWGLLNIAEAASSLGESAHGKHLVVFALFLVFCGHLFVTSAGNTWSWAERALSLSHMAFFCNIYFCKMVCASRILLQSFCGNTAFRSCWVQENAAELFCGSRGLNSTAFELLLVSDSSLRLWHSWRLSPVEHTACPVYSKQDPDVCVVTLLPFALAEARQLYRSYM